MAPFFPVLGATWTTERRLGVVGFGGAVGRLLAYSRVVSSLENSTVKEELPHGRNNPNMELEYAAYLAGLTRGAGLALRER